MFRPAGRPGLYAGLAVVILLFIVLVVARQDATIQVLRAPGVEADLAALPGYALQSLLRQLAAFVICLVLALTVGGMMGRDERVARVVLPLLDVGQSVPVLGFFPVVILVFVNVFGGSRFGLELSAVFLLVTCQLWNLIFGMYESIASVPRELEQSARSMGLSGGLIFRRLFLPASLPRLVYNSILSWANGWYFLIAVELFTLGPRSYRLPGLGSFLMTAAAEGKVSSLVVGLMLLVGIVVALDVFVWRPLTQWAERFRYDVGGGHSLPAAARFRFAWADWLDPSRLGAFREPVEIIWAPGRWVVHALAQAGSAVLAGVAKLVGSPIGKRLGTLVLVSLPTLVMAIAGYAAFRTILWISAHPFPPEARDIPKALLFSTLRVGVALAIAIAWAVPMAVYLFHRPRASRFWVPAFQIAASVPVTALFPVLVAIFLRFSWGMEVVSVVLLLTGMQWYLLFNVLAGVSQIPEEMAQTMRSIGASDRLYWRKLLIPAMLPSLITGCLVAWGGGWNAVILSEYMVYGEKRYWVDGLGSLLKRASEVQGNVGLLVLALGVMVGFILLVNRVVWRPAYDIAFRRYRLEL